MSANLENAPSPSPEHHLPMRQIGASSLHNLQRTCGNESEKRGNERGEILTMGTWLKRQAFMVTAKVQYGLVKDG